MSTVVDQERATEPLPLSRVSSTASSAAEARVLGDLARAGQRLAENAPPLTAEQVDRVVAILRMSDDVGLKNIA